MGDEESDRDKAFIGKIKGVVKTQGGTAEIFKHPQGGLNVRFVNVGQRPGKLVDQTKNPPTEEIVSGAKKGQ